MAYSPAILPTKERRATHASTNGQWEDSFESLPQVNRVQEYDFKFLRRLLERFDNADSYLTSPAYYLYTGRKGLWVFNDIDSLLMVCWHPNVEGRIVIFVPSMENGMEALQSLLDVIPAAPNGIMVARVRGEQMDALLQPALRGKLQPKQETVLDWIFPVHILSTETSSLLEGPCFQRLRNKIRQVEKMSVRVEPFNAILHSREIENLLHTWSLRNAANPEEYENLYAPYDAVFSQSVENESGLSGIMVFIDGSLQAIGLWDTSNTQNKTANLFVNLCGDLIKGLPEYLIRECCKAVRAQGIAYLNLGGSETAGLDFHKRRFHPTLSLEMASMEMCEASEDLLLREKHVQAS